ncbi:hypothetical protein [Pseudomonas sp. LB3P14]
MSVQNTTGTLGNTGVDHHVAGCPLIALAGAEKTGRNQARHQP